MGDREQDRPDECITDALRELAHYARAAGSFVVALPPALTTATTTHEWPPHLDESQTVPFPSFPFDHFAWCTEALDRGETVAVRTPGDVPPEAQGARQSMEACGFRPLLFIPMKLGDTLYGCLGFYGPIGQEQDWPEESLPLLQSAANLIAEGMQAKEASRESEIQYHSLFENAPVGIGVADGRGKLLAFNDAMLRPGGYSRADIVEIGQIAALYYDPQDRDEVQDLLEKRGFVEGHKVRFRRKDGTPYLASLSLSRVTFQGRSCTQALVEDITERTRMERSLRFTQYSVDHAADNIFWLDQDGKIAYASEATCERLGYTLEEMLQLNIYDIDTAAPSPWHEHWEKVRDEGRRTFEVIHRAKDGTCVPVEVSTNLVVYEGKQYHFSYARDITERKRAEEERERLQSQLLHAQKMESVGRLAGGVAHDFNNMLEVILGHAELAMDQLGQSHPVSSDLREIRRAAERSANITRQLLAFARRQIVVPKVIDLNETVTGTIKMLERLIGESIELLWHPGCNLGSVEMDPAQIDQTLVNLCINARDALGGTGTITIETAAASIDENFSASHEGSVPGDYVLLTVSDNGCGMDQDLLAHMFEPFFTTKETGKGTGLGLATIYGIVRQNCGFLDVQSEPSLGTSVSVYLPRHGGVLSQAEDQPAASPTLPIGNGEIVLVVEDEIPILVLIERALTRVNYRVLTASTPSEALRTAEGCPDKIALLITDVVMPEMDGWDLARQLSSLRPDLKTLFMSGYAADIVSGRKMLDREVRFMQKPFSTRELITAVRAALDQK
jgi:PAS domain S-box-containing protein